MEKERQDIVPITQYLWKEYFKLESYQEMEKKKKILYAER